MPDAPARIARVRLARSLSRLLAAPAIIILAGAGLAAGGAVLGPMPAGWAFVAAGALLGVVGLAWAARLLSVRLDVEEAAIRVRWLGGGRRYVLSPGAVTRVRLRGEDASRLRTRTGFLGWGLGRGRLRDEEDVHVVRLAPTPTAILVPTRDGRLAIAATEESELLDALARAARARQRASEEAAAAAEAPPAMPAPPAPVEAEPAAEEAPPPQVEPEPRFMTGIERALYERRLAEALEAAPAVTATGEPELGVETTQASAEVIEPGAAARPAVAGDGAAAEVGGRRRGLPRARTRRPSVASAVVLLPILAAGAVWGAALAGDRLPPAETDLGRLTALALVLAGPASAVGAIVARVWWPRLAGAMVIAGLAAIVLVGRALLS